MFENEKKTENETKQIRIEIKVDGIEGWLEMVQKLTDMARRGKHFTEMIF